MQFDEFPGQGQAQTRPLILPRMRGVHLRERIEDALPIFCFDPDASVRDRNVEKAGNLRSAIWTLGFLQFLTPTHFHRHSPPCGRKLHRVTQQVIEDLLELGGVGFDGGWRELPLSRYFERQERCFLAATGLTSATMACKLETTSNFSSARSTRSASIFERSRISLISSRR